MDIPSVKGYGDYEVEPFEEYLKRWPEELISFPTCLIRNWVHRHWYEFSEYWHPLGALKWKYEKQNFDNEKLLSISHHGDWIEQFDYWGSELFKKKQRQETWLGKYMLEHGTTPAPILVLENAGSIIHPRGLPGEKMCEPLQLIEGHMRTAYLRGMINEKYKKLRNHHEVWVATIT